jgi:cytochrome c
MKKPLVALTAFLLAATPLQAQDNASLRSDLTGVYTQAQAERGHQLYAFRCARCHDFGFSDAPALDSARVSSDFQGRILFELVDLIHASMPLDQPGTTPHPEATVLAAFILSGMHVPTGETELPDDDSVLRTIRIDAPR